jgi:hypothetical protein
MDGLLQACCNCFALDTFCIRKKYREHIILESTF